MRAWYCQSCRQYQQTAGYLLQPDDTGVELRVCAICANGRPSPATIPVAQVYRNKRGDTVAYGRIKPHPGAQ